MLKYPGATWRPLGKQTQPAMTAHDVVCAHTMVGNLDSTDAMFMKNGYGGTESTYGVGGDWGPDHTNGWDGKVYQWQDRRYTADANFDGNPRVISVETGDNAPSSPADIKPWTDKQLDALVDLFAWECSLAAHAECPVSWECRKGSTWNGVRVAIPPVLIPDTKPSRRGLAYHRQGVLHSGGYGIGDYLVRGGEKWSTSTGKQCPGDARIKQFKEIVIPRVQARLLGKDTPVSDPADGTILDLDVIPVTETSTADTNPTWKVKNAIGSTLDHAIMGERRAINLANRLDQVHAMLAALLQFHSIPLPDGVSPTPPQFSRD